MSKFPACGQHQLCYQSAPGPSSSISTGSANCRQKETSLGSCCHDQRIWKFRRYSIYKIVCKTKPHLSSPPPQFLSLFFGGGGGQERFTKCALLTFFPDFPGFLQSRSTRVEWSSSHLLPWLPSAHEAPPGEHNDRKAKGEKWDLQQEWQSSKLKPRIPKPVFVSQSNKWPSQGALETTRPATLESF